MSHVTLTEFRANIASHLDRLESDRDRLIITRQGHEPMVVMPLKDLQGWEETIYLLSNRANAEMLKASIQQLEAGETVEVDPATFKPLR
ncbi:MAG: type II toxin-antitoxin system Phd/YefM family antitoxin [Bosea sp. (in: a-proteobacteria)]